MSRSAYRASVEPEKCVACGRCVEYCPAGAAKLGQKLCTKDGGHITYPQQELPDTTKIIIAQRVSSVQDADRILVMDGGRIVESGTHEELLALNGIYREVNDSQTKSKEA